MDATADQTLPIDALTPDPRNPRAIAEPALAGLGVSVETFGDLSGIVFNTRTGHLVAGHQRLRALKAAGVTSWQRAGNDGVIVHPRSGERFRVRVVDWDETTERFANLTANNPAIQGTFTEEAAEQLAALAAEDGQAALMESLKLDDLLKELSGDDGAGDGAGGDAAGPSLADRFGVPPFTVLDARQGYWQDRKRAWLSIGMRSELGRGDALTMGESPCAEPGLNFYRNKEKAGARLTYVQGERTEDLDDVSARIVDTTGSGTSIFDPVLCELAYTWFSPPDGHVLDPFAGGSVRGIVASRLGRAYTGVDLREQQVAANIEQGQELCGANPPRWVCGDSRGIRTLAPGAYDFVFSCPPYADLEVYSDDVRDLSTMPYDAFLEAYRRIIAEACAVLKDDRFACFVVGDVRDGRGLYRNFVGHTTQAFLDAGLALYNEAVLVTAVGSVSIRAGRQMEISRKLGKAHQNVLVFVKGDPRRATAACGTIEITWPEEEDSNPEPADD